MKIVKANHIIKNGLKEGFIIEFSRITGSGGIMEGQLTQDRIPDFGDALIPTYQEAEDLMTRLEKASNGEYLNFKIVKSNFGKAVKPVEVLPAVGALIVEEPVEAKPVMKKSKKKGNKIRSIY